MLLIFCEKKTPRLEYIFETLLFAINCEYALCCDKEFYRTTEANGYLNYSNARLRHDEVFIQPHVILFERDIKPQLIDVGLWNDHLSFFQSNSDLSFDLFAASFYLITRYEEYLPFQSDPIGRFPHKISLAYRKEFLHLPLVNIWLNYLQRLLQNKFPGLHFTERKFEFVPTYDIDTAYRFKRNQWLNVISFVNRTIRLDIADIKHQVAFFLGREKDSYDVFDQLHTLHEKFNLRPIYFFLLAARRSKLNNNVKAECLERLILQRYFDSAVGMHPSGDADNLDELIREKRRLEQMIDAKVTLSRQHYILLKFPETYRNLLTAGITEDHSMGYSTVNGFRASFTDSFYFFDLQSNVKTNLRVHPFCFMDACSCYNLKQSAGEAFEELQELYKTVKSLNGKMITVFHNTLLTAEKNVFPWRKRYEDFLQRITA